MSSSSSVPSAHFSSLRCPCHNLLFVSKQDYSQHMHPVAFSSVGTGDYQHWLDTVNIDAPKPKLAPAKPNYTLRRLTETHKKKRTIVVLPNINSSTASQQKAQTARSMRARGSGVGGMPPALKHLHSLVTPPGGVYQNFLYYIIHYGTVHQQDEHAPSLLDEESLQQIQVFFDALDTDGDGLVNQADISVAAEMIGTTYNPLFFRKIDKTRKGYATMQEVVKTFFPHYTLKRVGTIIQKLSKPPPTILTTRQKISAEHLAEIDKLYNMYAALPGGCTLNNMLSRLSAYQRERADAIAITFNQFAGDKGYLSLEDYTELVKPSYPPFKQSETFVEHLDSSPLSNTSHLLDRDKRIFCPSLDGRLAATTKPYGVTELLAVKANSRQSKALHNLNKQSRLLHLSPTVRHYAGDPNPNLLGDEGSDEDTIIEGA